MIRIEHLGIAVCNINESITLFENLLNTKCYKTEGVESEGVRTAFFQIGDSKIELLEATNPESPIAKYLVKQGQGIHHIAFEVENIEEELMKGLDSNEQLYLSTKYPIDKGWRDTTIKV